MCLGNSVKHFDENFTTLIAVGIFVALNEDIGGMIHTSDLSWEKSSEDAIKEYKKGLVVKAKILDVDVEKERIFLGAKQLTDDSFASASLGDILGDTLGDTLAKAKKSSKKSKESE